MRKIRKLMIIGGITTWCFGCSGSNTPTTTPPPDQAKFATVRFVYRASTAIDDDVRVKYPACVRSVGRTHLHPSWRDFQRKTMVAVGTDRWDLTYDDVPVDQQVSFRINDPNECKNNPTGATTDNIFANDVRLTTVVSTPGEGEEPGLAFRVAPNGTVTP